MLKVNLFLLLPIYLMLNYLQDLAEVELAILATMPREDFIYILGLWFQFLVKNPLRKTRPSIT